MHSWHDGRMRSRSGRPGVMYGRNGESGSKTPHTTQHKFGSGYGLRIRIRTLSLAVSTRLNR